MFTTFILEEPGYTKIIEVCMVAHGIDGRHMSLMHTPQGAALVAGLIVTLGYLPYKISPL